ncbi:MAG TPA: YidC/Oxa1 family membrane protein insertase [Solirubrobacteraceae bacterium]|jgi:YidC/Oxa1 family membrane protein insertase|nr:YidC/Oxa1 family membrane protein insertase [Solirubrobacteraceae bacterium]
MIPSASTAFVLALLAPIQWIVDLLKPVLIFFHDSIGVGWGMSIVLLTVVVRALLAPLTVKQFKSMQSMVRVAPQLKELQAKHKDDKQRQQQEVMKFYAENKINPFASCLPLVAQMPFFIGLFYLLQTDLRREICGQALNAADKVAGKLPACGTLDGANGSERFLFIPDLTGIPTGWVLGVLITMYIASQLLSSLLTPSTADRNQRLIMYALPFVFVFFVIHFPAGLIVYWITTNLWTVAQGYILRRRMGPIAAPAGEPALAGIAGTGTGSARGGGFMARLAAATGAGSANVSDEANEGRAKSNGAKERTRATTAAKSGAAKSGGGKSSGVPSSGAPSGGGAGRAGRASSKSAGATATPPAAKPAREGAPPPPPRKKKKRSGRRR